MKKYFGYIRVSTTKQGEQGSSLREQKAAIEAYAKRHGLKIIEWFEEQETAASQGRPVFGKMLKAIERKLADGVITHKIDRSARNLKDWAHIGELIDRGVEMHFAHESLDLASRSGRLSADILAVVASDYIRNLRDEVRKGFYGRLKQGLYPLGAPLGYLDQGGGKPKTIDPIRGPLVRQAFTLYATGLWSLETLNEELYRQGLRNRRGGRVTRTGLSIMLNNPFYMGVIKLRKTQQVFEGVHEPLIDVKLFEDVSDVLAGRTPRRGARRTYRYQRMIRCAACGNSLTPERQKGHVYYRCHTRGCVGACVREEHIDQELVAAAQPLQFTDPELAACAADVDALILANAADIPKERDRLALQLAALEERIKRTTDAFVDGIVDKDAYIERKESLTIERASLRSQLTQLDDGIGLWRSKAAQVFELLRALQSLAILTPDDRLREILADTTSNLVAVGKKLVIDWRNPFAAIRKTRLVLLCGPDRCDLRTSVLAQEMAKAIRDMHDDNPDVANDNDPNARRARPSRHSHTRKKRRRSSDDGHIPAFVEIDRNYSPGLKAMLKMNREKHVQNQEDI